MSCVPEGMPEGSAPAGGTGEKEAALVRVPYQNSTFVSIFLILTAGDEDKSQIHLQDAEVR